MVTKIQNDDFTAIQNSPVALVDFSATWCGPCRMLAPIVDKLAEEMKDKLSFFNIDTDDNNRLAARFGIQSIPTILLLKNGKVVAQTVGFQPEAQLRSWIESHI